MSTGYSWEGIRQVRATLLGARHVSERLCGGRVYLGCYIKCSTFYLYLYWLCESSLFLPWPVHVMQWVSCKPKHGVGTRTRINVNVAWHFLTLRAQISRATTTLPTDVLLDTRATTAGKSLKGYDPELPVSERARADVVVIETGHVTWV